MSLISHLVFYLHGYMKRLIFELVDFLIGPVRYYLSDLEFDEQIYIEACQRADHFVRNKYHLCKIFALLFEYACKLVICWFFDFVLMQVLVFGKHQGHVLIIPCQKMRLDTKSVNSRFVIHPPSITAPRCN
jgi:hypothetical protein